VVSGKLTLKYSESSGQLCVMTPKVGRFATVPFSQNSEYFRVNLPETHIARYKVGWRGERLWVLQKWDCLSSRTWQPLVDN
jgi:hypothetical protein